MKRYAKWLLLLTKRLYKKATFVIILALIPIVVLSLGIVAKEDSGFISIALAQEDNSDSLSNEIINDLINDGNLMYFTYCESPEQAEEMVEMGQVDAAWIFPYDMQGRVDRFVSTQNEDDYIVTVVEREQNVALRLSHEKLSSAVYKYCAKTLYVNFTREKIVQLDDIDDKKLLSYYDAYAVEDKLFEFAYPKDRISDIKTNEINYLTAPVRGLLSILVVLCGLATAMYYIQDEEKGTFALLPMSKKPYIEFLCQIISIVNISVIMLLALIISGLSVSILREIGVLILYVLACTLFCMLLRQLLKNIKILASSIPLLITIMIVVCPVFFDFKEIKFVQILFPPTYYINAISSNKYVIYILVYIMCLALLNGICRYIGCRKYK